RAGEATHARAGLLERRHEPTPLCGSQELVVRARPEYWETSARVRRWWADRSAYRAGTGPGAFERPGKQSGRGVSGHADPGYGDLRGSAIGARTRTGVRCAHGQAAMDVPHRPAA